MTQDAHEQALETQPTSETQSQPETEEVVDPPVFHDLSVPAGWIPYTTVTGLVWADEAATAINCTVVFPSVMDGEPIPYTAISSDPGFPHSEEIFARAVAGEFGEIAPYVAPVIDLGALKVDLCAQIDAAAEAERARYITPGSGQAMTYQAKAAEAERLAADPAPDAAAYPLLSAEVGVTAEALADVGVVVRAAHAQWQIMGGAIERARLAGKATVLAAVDEAGARAAAEVVWPSG
ncbi:hypothetical protein [Castellaniella sp.]|uniref:hypothetical protein n=1 Tax=Castellaniella sp. TaxID=1955812 RepID=UPI002AFFFA9F|nr:hypothetical protein [Castellaniella sp.]